MRIAGSVLVCGKTAPEARRAWLRFKMESAKELISKQASPRVRTAIRNHMRKVLDE